MLFFGNTATDRKNKSMSRKTSLIIMTLAFLLMLSACFSKQPDGYNFVSYESYPDFGTLSAELSPRILDLSEWNEGKVPEYDSSRWTLAAFEPGQEWEVFIHNGQVCYDYYRAHAAIRFDLPDGGFYGLNQGERGGYLSYYDYYNNVYIVLDCNPKGIFVLDNSIFLLDGMESVNGSRNALHQLFLDGITWRSTAIGNLSGAPMAFTLSGGRAYVATMSGIDRLELVGNELLIEHILEYQFSPGLPPLSIAKDANLFYMTVWGGLLVYDETSGELKWYEKKNS